ncbi:MAG: hypothetical protein WC497_05560 [Patescibacteria group bacterium]
MDQSSQSSVSPSGLADFVLSRYKNWAENRSAVQNKWNSNNAAFRGVSENKWKAKEGEKWRSNTFINVTKQKAVSACALVIDMLLAGGKIPFILKPSPWDDVQLEDMAPDAQEATKKSIDDMRRIIEQQLLDCNADRVLMKGVLSEAVYGEAIVKKIVHEVERNSWQSGVQIGEQVTDVGRVPVEYKTFEKVTQRNMAPGVAFVPVWDFFRDMETEDLRAGVGCLHRQLVSSFWLRNKKGRSFYIDANIETALSIAVRADTGSKQPEQDSSSLAPSLRDIKYRQNTILYLEFWGRVPKEIAEAFEAEMFKGANAPTVAFEDQGEAGDEVEVMVCVAGDQVVRYTRSVASERPFYRAVWEDSLDGQGAISVADNAANSQFILNGAIRSYEDNKTLSANVILAGKRRYIEGEFKEISTGLFLDIAEDCDDVRKAVTPIVIPDVGESLLSLIALAEKYCDMDTLIPKLTQGLDVKEPQMRAYVAQQQVEKSGKYIGSVIRNNDEGLIEPIVEGFYDYNMNDPSVVKGKGSYVVKALGFTSFQDRIERIEKLKSMLTLVLSSPELMKESKLRWYLDEIAKALDMDPEQAVKSEQEKAVEAQNVQPDPLVHAQTAKLTAEAARAEADAQAKTAGIQTDAEKLILDRAKTVHAMETKSVAPMVGVPKGNNGQNVPAGAT